MTPAVSARLASLRLRIRTALFLGGAAEATLILGALAGTTLVALRLADIRPDPSWGWTAALIAPALWGAFRAARRAPSAAATATWLDRRAGLGGLLLVKSETDAAAWTDELEARAGAAPDVLPRFRVRPLALRTALGLAFVGAVLALPAPKPSRPRPVFSAMVAAVDELQRRVEDLLRHEAVDARTAEEIKRRLDEAEKKLEDGEPVEWRELDALEQRLKQAEAEKQDAMETAADALAALAAGAGDTEAAGTADAVRAALEKAAASGALDGLPQDMKDRLGLGGGDDSRGLDVASLPRTAEELKKLAADIANLLQGELGDLAAAGLGDAKAGKALGELGEGEWAEAEEHVHSEECEGGT